MYLFPTLQPIGKPMSGLDDAIKDIPNDEDAATRANILAHILGPMADAGEVVGVMVDGELLTRMNGQWMPSEEGEA